MVKKKQSAFDKRLVRNNQNLNHRLKNSWKSEDHQMDVTCHHVLAIRQFALPFDNPLLEELQASMTPQEKM